MKKRFISDANGCKTSTIRAGRGGVAAAATKLGEMKSRPMERGCGFRPKWMPFAQGWTLVELLVVVAIVVVLVALSFAMFQRVRVTAKSATCVANVRQVGMALIEYANDHRGKLIPLQPSTNPDTGKRPPIWTVQLALGGYLSDWDGKGDAPCGTGVWTCPECDFMSNAYGGYGVVEGTIFVYEENKPIGVDEVGSLRLMKVFDPSRTWLVGDASGKASEPKKGWYAIWSQPARWSGHGPAERHQGKVNVCMMDGSVQSLTRREIEQRKLTEDVLGP